MASSTSRRRMEIPVALFEALEEVAKRQDMPTSALAAMWLWEHLEQKARIPGHYAEGIHAPQPYRMDGPQMYPRRDRREDDHSQQAYAAKLEEHQAFIANERGE